MTVIEKLNKKLEEKGLNQKYNIVYEGLFWSLRDENGAQVYGDNNEKNVLSFIDDLKPENSVAIVLDNNDYFVVTPMSTEREEALSEVNNWINTYKEYLTGHIEKVSLLSELTNSEIEVLKFIEVKEINEEYAKKLPALKKEETEVVQTPVKASKPVFHKK